MPRTIRWSRLVAAVALVGWLSLLAGGLPGQNSDVGGAGPTPPPAAQSGDEPKIRPVEFGRAGEVGSLKVWFYEELGSIRAIQLRDDYRSAAARKQADKESGDYYLLVDVPGRFRGVPSLLLEELRPRFDEVDLAGPGWRRGEQTARSITYVLDCGGGLTFEKVFRHEPGFRGLFLELRLRAASGAEPRDREVPLRLRGPALRNPNSEHILGANPAIAVAVFREGDEERIESERAAGKPLEKILASGEVVFAGTTNRFFGAFLAPVDDDAARALRAVTAVTAPADTPIDEHTRFTIPVALYDLYLPMPPAGGVSALSYRLYLGPKSARVFDERPEYAPYAAVLDIDLQPAGCFCDIPGARPMAKLLLWLLRALHDVVQNWGVAIILMTIVVRSLMVPLNFRMQKSMRAYGAKMMRLKPELERLQAKVKQDPKQHQREMLEFQRKNKLFPPLGGCLPMLLISFPVFIGLFTALRVAYELRNQPFLPIWLTDLSRPDSLLALGFWPGQLNLLPIIMVCLWMYLQFSSPLPKDPQQRQMMKIMRFMPLMFGVMLYSYASGLMLYMITSSCFAIVETRVTKKVLGPMPSEAAGMAPATF